MAQRIPDFATYRQNYNGATVTAYKANTTTLADLFQDVDGTVPAANPQVLDTLELSGLLFGRFVQPIYVAEDYYLSIDDGTQTGVVRISLTSLDGQDGSALTVQPDGATEDTALSTLLSRVVFAEDYGVINASDSAANTATIQAAIGAVAGRSGGFVSLPSGNIPFTTLTLPANVILLGYSEAATVLQSQEAQAVITLTGANAGLESLTLDGISLAANSIGLKLRGIQYSILRDVTIQRFNIGSDASGAKFASWKDLTITNCSTNLKLYGDSTDSGGPCGYITWEGGCCTLAAVVAIDMSFEDQETSFLHFEKVLFDSNLKAIRDNGARFVTFDKCEFTNNTTLVDLLDDTATTGNNNVFGFSIARSILNTGQFLAQNTMSDVKLIECDIRGVNIKLTTPLNALVLIDCVEDAAVTIDATGDGTKVVRLFSPLKGATKGVTTGSAATKAASLILKPGEMCTGHAKVTGKQRNGIDKATYVFTFTAQKAPDTLAYDTQTANFTVGALLTGATSGATGRIVADSDSGTTGSLTLHTITGAFVDNEIITDGVGGSATANGTLVEGSVTILDQDLQSGSETDSTWDCSAAGSVEECEIRVTGAASKTIDWTVYVDFWRFG